MMVMISSTMDQLPAGKLANYPNYSTQIIPQTNNRELTCAPLHTVVSVLSSARGVLHGGV